MTTTDVVTRNIEAFNKHDPQLFASCYEPIAKVSDPMYSDPLEGHDAISRDVSDFFNAFPDIHSDVENLMADGESYAVEASVKGTHQGELMISGLKVPPTGKPVTVKMSFFGKVDDQGKIVEEHRYYDVDGLLSQLGVKH